MVFKEYFWKLFQSSVPVISCKSQRFHISDYFSILDRLWLRFCPSSPTITSLFLSIWILNGNWVRNVRHPENLGYSRNLGDNLSLLSLSLRAELPSGQLTISELFIQRKDWLRFQIWLYVGHAHVRRFSKNTKSFIFLQTCLTWRRQAGFSNRQKIAILSSSIWIQSEAWVDAVWDNTSHRWNLAPAPNWVEQALTAGWNSDNEDVLQYFDLDNEKEFETLSNVLF